MSKRIVVTGGSGKAGVHVLQYLLDQGYEVLNLDLRPVHGSLAERVYTIIVDLTDAGQVYSALLSHFRPSEPFHGPLGAVPDAVIHLAGMARPLIVPDNETFRINTMGGYNVIEASCRLGINKIILASTICTYGITYAEGVVDFPSFPVDEEVDANPMDTYALSKVCVERTARSFALKFNKDIFCYRIGAVILPEEYNASFKRYVEEPSDFKVHGWSYTDARDLGKMCALGIEKSGLGFHIFNATNDTITNNSACATTFLKEQCPGTPFTREMGPLEAPVTNRKMKELLGFEEDHDWRKYYEGSS